MGSERNRSKCKSRSYGFSTRILTKLFELKGEMCVCVCFFLMYSSRGFLRGSCRSSGKALGYGFDRPGVEAVEIFSLLRIQTAPGVHYKMSTGVKAAERRTSYPTFS